MRWAEIMRKTFFTPKKGDGLFHVVYDLLIWANDLKLPVIFNYCIFFNLLRACETFRMIDEFSIFFTRAKV